MSPALSPSLLSQLSEFVAGQMGLHFPPERWADLERGIAAAATDLHFRDRESCARWLLSAPPERRTHEILASRLSVGETYFFRETPGLEAFSERILPELLQQRRQNERRLRLWSAGCCTGEEAYTLAILLDRLIPDLDEWNITLLATDFNPEFLRKAAAGIYGNWSFRDAPAWLRERYFNKTPDGSYAIHPRIRKMVTFSYLNFADDVYPSLANNTGAMDVIFCRNVLMYFSAQRARQVSENFHRALVEGGWLIVSPAEASNSLLSSFTPLTFPGGTLYRKTAGAPAACPAMYPAPPPPQADVAPVFQFAPETEIAATPADIPAAPVTAAQPDDREPPSRLARACANQGRLAEALAWCEKAISADKLNPAHHYLLSTILQEQGRPDDAIPPLTRALYLDPDFVLAHFALGNLHQAQGRYRQAQRHFHNALLLLRRHAPEEILPESDGLTAGRLAAVIAASLTSLPQAAAAAA